MFILFLKPTLPPLFPLQPKQFVVLPVHFLLGLSRQEFIHSKNNLSSTLYRPHIFQEEGKGGGVMLDKQ